MPSRIEWLPPGLTTVASESGTTTQWCGLPPTRTAVYWFGLTQTPSNPVGKSAPKAFSFAVGPPSAPTGQV